MGRNQCQHQALCLPWLGTAHPTGLPMLHLPAGAEGTGCAGSTLAVCPPSCGGMGY